MFCRHQLLVGRQQRGQGRRQTRDISGHPSRKRVGHSCRRTDETGQSSRPQPKADTLMGLPSIALLVCLERLLSNGTTKPYAKVLMRE